MGKTKRKKVDDRTPAQKLKTHEKSKFALLIFFGYYDGFVSKGVNGFKCTKKHKVGSVHHMRTTVCQHVMTAAQFRSKALDVAQIAQDFIAKKELPSNSLRPVFTTEEYNEIEANIKKQKDFDPMPALSKVKDEKAKFVFFQYYDGIKSKGDKGFNMKAGGYGSIHHFRMYPKYFVQPHGENWFRKTGHDLGKLARKFVDRGQVPPDEMRPTMVPEKITPSGMIAAAQQTAYY